MDFLITNNNKSFKNYKPFNNYALNGCYYIFKNIFIDDDNNYYQLNNKNKYIKIKPKFINSIKYISVKDINNNSINILI